MPENHQEYAALVYFGYSSGGNSTNTHLGDADAVTQTVRMNYVKTTGRRDHGAGLKYRALTTCGMSASRAADRREAQRSHQILWLAAMSRRPPMPPGRAI